MNPVIKFTTLFGLLAVELAVTLSSDKPLLAHTLAVIFFLISMFFVWKSFLYLSLLFLVPVFNIFKQLVNRHWPFLGTNINL